MKKFVYVLFCFASMTIVAGCAFKGQAYQSSYESVSELKNAQEKSGLINIADFTASEQARDDIISNSRRIKK